VGSLDQLQAECESIKEIKNGADELANRWVQNAWVGRLKESRQEVFRSSSFSARALLIWDARELFQPVWIKRQKPAKQFSE
jgi:hypothetical protein